MCHADLVILNFVQLALLCTGRRTFSRKIVNRARLAEASADGDLRSLDVNYHLEGKIAGILEVSSLSLGSVGFVCPYLHVCMGIYLHLCSFLCLQIGGKD